MYPHKLTISLFKVTADITTDTERKIQTILNILKLTPKIMKYCNDCLTPIKSDSREEYCAICKKDRALKENSVA
jgi:hypothetical protein